jgi:hypothetical protein
LPTMPAPMMTALARAGISVMVIMIATHYVGPWAVKYAASPPRNCRS